MATPDYLATRTTDGHTTVPTNNDRHQAGDGKGTLAGGMDRGSAV
jgi:hypothetical protein